MISATVRGLPDLRAALAGIAPKLRVRALRNALAAGARIVQRAERARAPVLSPGAVAVRKGWRTPGLVRKAISVRTSKLASRAGDVGVFVNVRPAKGAVTRRIAGRRQVVRVSARGAKSPRDPFYWRFINFGTAKGVRAARFVEAGVAQLPAALQAFIATIGPQIAKLNRPKAPAP